VTLSAYIHFPYCLQKCPYCDFASTGIARQDVPQRAYTDAVLRELQQRAPALQHQRLSSIFFGGGTPSLWEPAELGRVLSALRAAFGDRVEPELEVSVECNPSSLDAARARALSAQGVDRLSIGVQGLDPVRLRFLGRMHDRQRALEALRDALGAVPRVSADLIFGLPGQSPAEAVSDALTLVDLGLSHLSAYALTIEEGTQFGQLARKGRLPLAREGDVADSLTAVAEALSARGFEHYEVSNHARPGQRARHNLHYWRGGAYLGLGAGAVGCLHEAVGSARRYRNDPDPARYMQRAGGPEREVFSEILGPQDMLREQLMLGLRTLDGVELARAQALTGRALSDGREAALERALSRGDAVLEDGFLRVPRARWLHLDSIVADLF